ncbi:hypothetical protein Tco_1255294 [Tanacetum coccineum]
MVAYLQKPEGSEAFHQIIDFLNASHIKYALIENLKIYISLIHQFWGIATARTTNDGEVEIIASIDGQVKTITEVSLRRHLKLEESDGITSLPNIEIFEDITRQDAEIPQSRFPTRTQVADEAAFISVDVDVGGAATIEIGLEVGQGSDTIHKTPSRPHDSPLLRVHTLGSDEGKNDLQQTKKVYSSALTKLILRVKKLEKKSKKQARRKGQDDFTTASVLVTTTSATPEVSTAAENLVYIRKSAEKRKDKGKAIMKEDEYVQKKTKKQLEQERLGHEEAIRLQEQINKEENQRIARDAKIAKQLQEEFDRARQEQELYHALQNISFSVAEVRKNMCMYLKNQGGYKQSHFKGMSYEDIRPIFKRVWDQNNAFVPKDSEIEKEKLENDAEKKELRDSMDVVPRDDIAIDVESLATKYPIVD